MGRVKDYLSNGYLCMNCGKYLGVPDQECQRTCTSEALQGKRDELLADRAREQAMDEDKSVIKPTTRSILED